MPANLKVKLSLVIPAALLALGPLTACGDGGVHPTAPSDSTATAAASPKPPPTPATTLSTGGRITMVESTPSIGASLLVGNCQFGTSTRRCANDWRGTFDASSTGGVDWPVLSVAFYDGDQLCGYAADVHLRMPAGETTTFRPARIVLSDEFGTFASPCALPVTITRIVAVLWSDSDWTTQLRQEFAGRYTFVGQ